MSHFFLFVSLKVPSGRCIKPFLFFSHFFFLAKIGGTMGLVIGASIFSILEILFFLLVLCKIVLRRLIH